MEEVKNTSNGGGDLTPKEGFVEVKENRLVSNVGAEFWKAMARFQSECPDIPRDRNVRMRLKSGRVLNYHYAPLESVLGAIRKAMHNAGLSVIHVPVEGNKISCVIGHVSGEMLVGEPFDIGYDEKDVKSFGAMLTYLRRYTIGSMLGISTDTDPDGHGASVSDKEEEGVQEKKKATKEVIEGMIKRIEGGKAEDDILEKGEEYFVFTKAQREEIAAAMKKAKSAKKAADKKDEK